MRLLEEKWALPLSLWVTAARRAAEGSLAEASLLDEASVSSSCVLIMSLSSFESWPWLVLVDGSSVSGSAMDTSPSSAISMSDSALVGSAIVNVVGV